MVFFITEDKKLKQLNIPTDHEEFFILQQNNPKRYIRVTEELPILPVRETFYKLDENNNIVIDEEKTRKENIPVLKREIRDEFESKIKKILEDKDYDDKGEVALYASNPNSKWNKEAKEIQTEIENIYDKMYELLDKITDENYIDFFKEEG